MDASSTKDRPTEPTREQLRARFFCLDCGLDTSMRGACEYYTLLSHVWADTGLGRDDGMLCIGCVETRLGRELTPDDFSDCPLNFEPRSSDRLKSRRGNDDLRALRVVVYGVEDEYFDVILAEAMRYLEERDG